MSSDFFSGDGARPWVSLSRPGDGTVLCCICFRYRTVDELLTDAAGDTWDVCDEGTCAEESGLSRPRRQAPPPEATHGGE